MSAPYYHALAQGPDARASMIRASDGTELRMVHWPRTAGSGTVFLFQGMGDYAEKYAHAARALIQRGYGVVTLDWRGQGLSERLHPFCVHTRQFSDYHLDVQAFIAASLDLPKPWFMVAHSMGGAIGLRHLMGTHPFSAVIFSAPMWRLRPLGAVGNAALRLAGAVRYGRETPLLYPRAPYMMLSSFRRNVLTSDPAMWAELIAHAAKMPDLVNCGPTLGWAVASAAECRELADLPSPDLPCITLVGTGEKLVDSRALRKRMDNWRDSKLVVIPGARHELMRERTGVLETFFNTCDSLFRR